MKYLILGAGPAGLTFANRLLQNGIDDFLVIEKGDEAGGLRRSREVDGAPLDIGGGHFLDVRNPKVLDFLFPFMPKELWDEYYETRLQTKKDNDARVTKKRLEEMRLSMMNLGMGGSYAYRNM